MNENDWMNPMMDEDFEQEHMMSLIMDALENLQTGSAYKLLQQYEEQYGPDEFWHIVLIDIDEQNGDSDVMFQDIQAAESFGADKDELALRYGRYYYMVGRPKEALEYLAKCEFDEDSDQGFYKTHLEAYCYLIDKDYKKAVDKLEDLMLDSEDYRLLILSSLCYKELGKMDRAWEYMTKALEKRDDFLPDYQAVLSDYDYDPQTIFDHSYEIFQKLAGSNAAELNPYLKKLQDLHTLISLLQNGVPADDPDLMEMLSQLSASDKTPMHFAVEAIHAQEKQDEKKAEKFWQKALDAAWDPDPFINCMFLYFRLMALEHVLPDDKQKQDRIWSMWRKHKEPVICAELMQYASEMSYKKVLEKMVHPNSSPVIDDPEMKNRYEMVRARALFELDRFEGATKIVHNLWDAMNQDPEYLILASSTAVITADEKTLQEVARRMMPHGVIAFHLLEYYDMENKPAKCRAVQKQMKDAMANPNVEVPEEDFYKEYLKNFQNRHRR